MPDVDNIVSFAGAPKTIGELRSDKTGNPRSWSPRDVLINMLRDIDEGQATPTVLIVAWGHIDEAGLTSSHYTVAGGDGYTVLGLLERVKNIIMGGA